MQQELLNAEERDKSSDDSGWGTHENPGPERLKAIRARCCVESSDAKASGSRATEVASAPQARDIPKVKLPEYMQLSLQRFMPAVCARHQKLQSAHREPTPSTSAPTSMERPVATPAASTLRTKKPRYVRSARRTSEGGLAANQGRLEITIAADDPRRPPLAVYESGELLDWTCQRCFDIALATVPHGQRNLSNFPSTYTWGSGCTGSGIDSDAHAAIIMEMNRRGFPVEGSSLFDAESCEPKRLWCQFTKREEDIAGCCSFAAIEKLSTGSAPCYNHGYPEGKAATGKNRKKSEPAHCNVPRVNCWNACTSCKYFSRMATSNADDGCKSTLLSDQDNTSQHQSKVTYEGHLAYIKTYRPDVVMYENTDAITDEHSADALVKNVDKTMDKILKDLAQAGYVARAWKVNSIDYWIPQHRLRIFVAGVRLVSRLHSADEDALNAAMDTVSLLMSKFQGPPRDYREIMLPDHDPAVRAELQRRIVAPDAADDRAGWPRMHQKEYRKYSTAGKPLRWGDEADMTPQQSTVDSRWYAPMTRRDQEVLNLSEKVYGRQTGVDHSQNIYRLRFDRTCHGVRCTPTLLPGTLLFRHACKVNGEAASESRDLVGREFLTLQAYPWQRKLDAIESWTAQLRTINPKTVPEKVLADLGGNAACGTVQVSVLAALCVSIPWVDAAVVDEQALLADIRHILGGGSA